ncbi:E3 ubiquitin-protein ligase dbl4 [Ceratocystis fimbriata CBS 114723]|uniref:RBR-type E3 ubiquitin transferase n=1 Tax=Ceratocystis fimbriata CBS 114723 TaxID=1035309 RepID=A0A2C5WVV8_9PEZI|nr:E3 ubiquitin-protein ligase dbl4 [Ceratocystis fimbriata CBS 114723]
MSLFRSSVLRFAAAAGPRPAAARAFSSSAQRFVKVGDAVPDLEVLCEDSPGNKVNLGDEFASENGIIIGVPAAFSGACSSSHVPSYMNHPKLKQAGQVFVVSVNDAFVMKAWHDQMDPAKQTKIRFLGDPSGAFTRALELDFDSKAIFGNDRSKRYALVIENGKVAKAFVEPDNIGTTATHLPTIPSLTRKRKAAEASQTASSPSHKKIAGASAALITTSPDSSSFPETTSTTSSTDSPTSPPNNIYSTSASVPPISVPIATACPPDSLAAPPSTSTPIPIPSNNDTNMYSDDEEVEYLSLSSDDDIMIDDDDSSGDIEVESGDDFEPDTDFTIDKASEPKKYTDVAYKVKLPVDLKKQQEDDISEVNMILDLGRDEVAILLRRFRWNKERLIEDYMDRPNKVLEDAGFASSSNIPLKIQTIPGFTCEICFDDEPGLESFAMKCEHRFCVSCYRQYLTQKIRGEGEAARIQCPHEGCRRILDAYSLNLLVTADLKDRYHSLLDRTYVEDSNKAKWCPAPDCPNAIECSIKRKDLDRIVPSVACLCGYRFCYGCLLGDHQPAPCDLVKRWLKKCADDSETANWISAHTKECPQCNSTIEKNGGCNHMTCRKCRYEFCWMCMGPWNEHGTSWYNCNRYEEKSGTEARDAQAKSRVSLQRYLHYYNRYANHEQSARLDKELAIRIENKMIQLQAASGLSWVEVQYLKSASQAVETCRETLKWTYAFAYYLARNNTTEMFEDNQKDLEMAVEALSHMFEKPVAELADSKQKTDIMDKTAYCNKRRVILLEYAAETLAKGRWTFNMTNEPITIQGGTTTSAAAPPHGTVTPA